MSQPLTRLTSSLRRNWRLLLLCLAALLLALTFIQPILPLQQASYRYVFILDITQSMNVRDSGKDGQESRLEVAKRAVDQALLALSQSCVNQAGLGLFTGHRSLLLMLPVDVCTHLHELRSELAQISSRMAWETRSEVAKGLYSGLVMARQLPSQSRLVFISDGHEAPPINVALPPKFNKGVPGDVDGLIVGVGGTGLTPIPKLNKAGEISGYWRADEVLQVDTVSLGRRTSSGREQLSGTGTETAQDSLQQRISAGTEHLSSLREDYLQELAAKTQLHYLRLDTPQDLVQRLRDRDFAEFIRVERDARWLFGSIALALLGLILLFDQFGRLQLGRQPGRQQSAS